MDPNLYDYDDSTWLEAAFLVCFIISFLPGMLNFVLAFFLCFVFFLASGYILGAIFGQLGFFVSLVASLLLLFSIILWALSSLIESFV